MEEEFLTVLNSKEVVLIVKRSKFIGNIKYVKTKEEALNFALKIKTKFKDATHNVVAYSLFFGNVLYCTDDGEPHGTAGKPILEILKKQKLFNVCVVVTRYFGGTLLGTGGLFFSYSSCCKKILFNSTFARCSLCEIFEIFISYKYLKNIENILLAYNVKKTKECYLENVCFNVVVEKKVCENFKNAFLKATKGEGKIIFKKQEWERLALK